MDKYHNTNKTSLRFRCEEDAYNKEEVAKKRYNQMNSLKMQLEWVKRQLEYISFAEQFSPSMHLKRGEIYEFDFGVNVNCEFANRHFGLVLADSHPGNPLVTVVPLKTNKFGGNPESDINIGIIDELISTHETLAVINQIRSLDKIRLYVRPIINRDNENEYRVMTLSKDKFDLVINGIKRYYLL